MAGYDLTFSPVKSISALWAIAPPEIAEQIEAAHEAAVADVLEWLQDNAAFTRTGTNGVAQVDTEGSSRRCSPIAIRVPGTPPIYTPM